MLSACGTQFKWACPGALGQQQQQQQHEKKQKQNVPIRLNFSKCFLLRFAFCLACFVPEMIKVFLVSSGKTNGSCRPAQLTVLIASCGTGCALFQRLDMEHAMRCVCALASSICHCRRCRRRRRSLGAPALVPSVRTIA